MKRNRVLTAALILFCFSHSSPASCNKAIVFYLPINIEEYVPGGFSNSNIKSVAAEKWAITEPSRIQRLLNILNAGKSHSYEDGSTRAQIECGDETFYLNKEGDVQSNGRSIRISIKKFLQFRDSLRPDELLKSD